MINTVFAALKAMAWVAMVTLAFTAGMSDLRHTPLSASTLRAITRDTGPLLAGLALYSCASGESQGLAPHASASSSSSIMRNNMVISGPIKSFADICIKLHAAYQLLLLQAGLLLAASMFIIVYVDGMLQCVHSWLLHVIDTMPDLEIVSAEGFPDVSLMSALLPKAGKVWRQLLPTSTHLLSSIDVQLGDIRYIVCSFLCCFGLGTHYSKESPG
jgi:hypothetical protein